MIKGITRKYRKTLKALGVKFPLKGAFHVINKTGEVLKPGEFDKDSRIHYGPAPQSNYVIPTKPKFDNPVVVDEDFGTARNKDLVIPNVYKRTERVGMSQGKEKKRVDYRLVKNPKGGELYWIKKDNKWVQVNYSNLLKADVA